MSGPLGWSRTERVRIAVAADHSLVAESVRAALHNRGYEAVIVRWPLCAPLAGPDDGATSTGTAGRAENALEQLRIAQSSGVVRRPRRSAGPPPAIAVMLSDLGRADQLGGARVLISRLHVPWLVLAGVPRGAAWGAVYEAGARLVVPTSTGLDQVCELMDDLVAGSTPVAVSRRQRRELVRAWRDLARERTALAARIETLTVREEEILQQLHAGQAVREIAGCGEVTEATVRSQVKAILRKLEVNSQLAAVAAYEELQNDPPCAQTPERPAPCP